MSPATFSGHLFNGETLASRPVTLHVEQDRLTSEDGTVNVALSTVRISDRLGSVPRYLYLDAQRSIETHDNATIDALMLSRQRGRWVAAVHWLERRSTVAAAATLLLVGITAATIRWGLPVAARRAAMAVPLEVEQAAGRTALVAISQALNPSALRSSDRDRVKQQVERLTLAGGLAEQPEVSYRSMGGKFPNAFALPGGKIVVSDELINLPVTDDELAAVLAHEFGHWQLRHGLQSLLRNSTALLVVSSITGDLSTLSTFSGTLPFLVLQNGYSREFEAEADEYAVRLLAKAKIDPMYFQSVLEKLAASRPTEGFDFTYLSTHPSTADRVRRINPAGRRPLPSAAVAEPPAAPPVVRTIVTKPVPAKSTGQSERPNSPPEKVYDQQPNYPRGLLAQGIEGHVTVQFIVDAEGVTRDVSAVESSDERFNDAAVEAVEQWKFHPGRREGRAITTRLSIVIEFKLDEAALKEKTKLATEAERTYAPVVPLEP